MPQQTTASQKKLSIIIPVYNTEKYLASCLDSVVHQSWKNLEVIIVDDATPDHAMEIAEEYAQQYPFIRILHHAENQGLFKARMTGMEAMTGDYFAFLDSDDSVTVDYYRLMMKKAIAANADIVVGDFIEIKEEGHKMVYTNTIFNQSNIDLKDKDILSFFLQQEGQDWGCHVVWNKIYDYKIFNSIKVFLQSQKVQLTMLEDVVYSTLFFSVAHHLVNVHGEYYCYLRNSAAATSIERLSYEKCKKSTHDVITAFQLVKLYFTECALSVWPESIETWEKNYVSIWMRHIGNCNCSSSQRKSLEAALLQGNKKENPEAKQKTIAIPLHAFLMRKFPLQEIKEAVLQSECQCVSFDVFDTLLLRPFWYPTDLFTFMEPEITRLIGTADDFRFNGLRQEAEWLARQYAIGNNQNHYGEVTLDQIYESMVRICPQMEPYAEQIKQLEIENEMRFCSARQKGKELVEFALDAGKHVICVSDMYLPAAVIAKMLEKSGIHGVENIFVSCEMGYNKHSGELYSLVQKQMGYDAKAFVHIGDNFESDVKRARERGWTAFYLPKVTDCMQNQAPGFQYGNLFGRLFHQNSGIRLTSAGFSWFFGMRCRMAVVANRLYDDPFVPVDPAADFNADPARIGYFAVGPYLLAIAQWLMELCQKEDFSQINFVARDGWLPMQAFKLLREAFGIQIPVNYLYVSRKTAFALLFSTPECLCTLPWGGYDLQTFCPEEFVELSKPVCEERSVAQLRNALQEERIAWEMPFGTNANYEKFLALFMELCYDKTKATRYSSMVKAYYEPMLCGKTALFDIGYSCRSEVLFKNLFHFDVSPCYLHVNGEIAALRSFVGNIPLRTFYDYSPAVTGALREHIISFQGPSCIGFDCSGEQAVPLFEPYHATFASTYVTTRLQNAALQYVKDMVSIFGKDLEMVYARKMDASWPMEYFLQHPSPADAELFNAIPFEDDLGVGRVTIRDIWERCLQSIQNTRNQNVQNQDDRLDYYSMGKLRKWLVWVLVDRKIMKDTAKRKMKDHPFFLRISGACYHGLKRVFHVFVK